MQQAGDGRKIKQTLTVLLVLRHQSHFRTQVTPLKGLLDDAFDFAFDFALAGPFSRRATYARAFTVSTMWHT